MNFKLMKIKYNKLLVNLIILSVFSKELFTYYIADFGIDFFAYPVAVLIFFIYLKYLDVNKKMVYFIIYSSLTAIISILIFDLNFLGFLKTIVPLLIVYLANYFVLNRHKFSINKIIKTYINIAYFSSLLGLLQLFLAGFGFNILYNKIPGKLTQLLTNPHLRNNITCSCFNLISIQKI